MRKYILIPLALTLAACGDDTREAGGVTKSEAKALDEAAEMVEQQRLPAGAASGGADAQAAGSPSSAASQRPGG